MNDLDELKKHFPGLEFDEPTHTYHVDGVKYPSVSGLLKNFYVPFDTENVAIGYARKHGFFTQDVLDAWEGNSTIATDRGTIVHLFGEDYVKWKYFGIGERPIVGCKQCLGVVQFWNSLPTYIIPVALEIQMYSKKYGYCGTADILLYNTKTKEYYIADYKTNKELTSQYDQSGLLFIKSSHGLVQDNFGKYTLQFSFYQILLEDVGINVTRRILIWLQEQPDKKLYKTFRTIDLTSEIREWFVFNYKPA